MERLLSERRRSPRWRRAKRLNFILGVTALLLALGTGSALAADPDEPPQTVPSTQVGEPPVVEAGGPIVIELEAPPEDPAAIEDPAEVEDPAEAEDPAEDPAEVEDPAEAEAPPADAGTCETSDEVPDPVENPGEAPDADDLPEGGAAEEPADPADCAPADVEDPVADPGTCAPDVEEPQGDPADVEVPGVTDPDDMGDPPDPADCAPADPQPIPVADAAAGEDGDAGGSDNHATVAISSGGGTNVELPPTDTLPGGATTLAVNESRAALGYLLLVVAGLAGGALSVVRTRR
jgi:hypothetical protein